MKNILNSRNKKSKDTLRLTPIKNEVSYNGRMSQTRLGHQFITKVTNTT